MIDFFLLIYYNVFVKKPAKRRKTVENVEIKLCPPYTVAVGDSAADLLPDVLGKMKKVGKIEVVTDENVAPLYLSKITDMLTKAGYDVANTVLPAGEKAKTEDTLFEILKKCAERGFNRSDLLVALGGGTVSDVTGLGASLYMRGIRYLTLPTTLLSAVDASVGGKCAIDFHGVKNLVGAFYQPSAVLIDPIFFGTLPERNKRDGMAEIIKYAAIDRDFANYYLQNDDICGRIGRAVALKALIVEQDEKDFGLRRVLNFGHTFGHAIEAASDFTVSHGEAVSVGMCLVTRAAVKRGLCSLSVYETLKAELLRHGLPTECPIPTDALLPYLTQDKKVSGGVLSLIVPVEFGQVRIIDVPKNEIALWLRDGAR